jgi:hypothetical protein
MNLPLGPVSQESERTLIISRTNVTVFARSRFQPLRQQRMHKQTLGAGQMIIDQKPVELTLHLRRDVPLCQ